MAKITKAQARLYSDLVRAWADNTAPISCAPEYKPALALVAAGLAEWDETRKPSKWGAQKYLKLKD